MLPALPALASSSLAGLRRRSIGTHHAIGKEISAAPTSAQLPSSSSSAQSSPPPRSFSCCTSCARAPRPISQVSCNRIPPTTPSAWAIFSTSTRRPSPSSGCRSRWPLPRSSSARSALSSCEKRIGPTPQPSPWLPEPSAFCSPRISACKLRAGAQLATARRHNRAAAPLRRPHRHPSGVRVRQHARLLSGRPGYTQQNGQPVAINPIHILEGRNANLWYGSFFPDTPPIFEIRSRSPRSGSARSESSSGKTSPTSPARCLRCPAPVYLIAKSGGKEIVSNQPNRP